MNLHPQPLLLPNSPNTILIFNHLTKNLNSRSRFTWLPQHNVIFETFVKNHDLEEVNCLETSNYPIEGLLKDLDLEKYQGLETKDGVDVMGLVIGKVRNKLRRVEKGMRGWKERVKGRDAKGMNQMSSTSATQSSTQLTTTTPITTATKSTSTQPTITSFFPFSSSLSTSLSSSSSLRSSSITNQFNHLDLDAKTTSTSTSTIPLTPSTTKHKTRKSKKRNKGKETKKQRRNMNNDDDDDDDDDDNDGNKSIDTIVHQTAQWAHEQRRHQRQGYPPISSPSNSSSPSSSTSYPSSSIDDSSSRSMISSRRSHRSGGTRKRVRVSKCGMEKVDEVNEDENRTAGNTQHQTNPNIPISMYGMNTGMLGLSGMGTAALTSPFGLLGLRARQGMGMSEAMLKENIFGFLKGDCDGDGDEEIWRRVEKVVKGLRG